MEIMKKTAKLVMGCAIAISLSGSLVGPVSAEGESDGTPTSTVAPKAGSRGLATKAIVTVIKEYRTALRAYVKSAKKGATPEFKEAVRTYAEARKSIEVAYRDAVKSAIETRKAAFQSNSTREGKKSAQDAFLVAISAAQAARSQSITDLGQAPTQ